LLAVTLPVSSAPLFLTRQITWSRSPTDMSYQFSFPLCFFLLWCLIINWLLVAYVSAQAVKKFGLWGLFTRGLPLRIVMIGTLTGLQWGTYGAFKVMVGL
jgi:hypothetical protein